ncbi:glycosyltransferase family 9 protein [Candidatus Woesearchaeota archaeon]|nr:glycosyltransferase family 9 protein [Candidatus Woesearchaeota archaeon]
MNVNTIKFFDKYLGNIACGFLRMFSSKSELEGINPSRILVLQFWGVGETILTLPAIRALGKRFPKAKIDVLATSRNKDVYFMNDDVSNILELKLGVGSVLKFILKNKYDLVVDMEEYLNVSSIISFFVGVNRIGFLDRIRGGMYNKAVFYNDKQHTIDTFLDLVSLVDAKLKVNKLIPVKYSKDDAKLVSGFMKEHDLGGNFIVGIAPGAAESARSRIWSMARYAKVANELVSKYDAKIIFIGNDKEKEHVQNVVNLVKKNAVNSAGVFSLKQLFAFVKKCNVVISNDSGPMHIAAAQGVKTIGLFGPNTPVRWAPYGVGNISIYKNVFCSPCIHTHLGIVPECKWAVTDERHVHCMKNISVEDVLEGFKKLVS